MSLQLSEVLKAVGPNASIVFAAWIFMGFLQQRYDSALDRYRAAVGDYRSNQHEQNRSDNLKDQVLTYRRRCELMGRATTVGLIAAMLLILALIIGAADVIWPGRAAIAIAGTATTIVGFALVIVAAGIVIAEGRIVNRQLDEELLDVPELAEGSGRASGVSR